MMVQLNAPRPTNEDVVALLLDCHERIRRFSAMAVRLAQAEAEEPALLQDAAQRVHRYFSVAFPLHVEDEEKSIRPRLEVIAPEVMAALQRMSSEHEQSDTLLVELLPVWDVLRQDPSRLTVPREWLQATTQAFHDAMLEHLALEETTLFPIMRRAWDAGTQATIVREMRGRRQVESPTSGPAAR